MKRSSACAYPEVRVLNRFFFPIVLTALSLLGAAAIILSTRSGIGLSPDSAIYIGAARNLLRGQGLSLSSYPGEWAPMTQYPPFYSMLLAAVGSVGIDPLEAINWLNALLFAGNIALVGFIVHYSTQSAALALFGSFLMLSSPDMIQIHLMAWSEPFFVFFTLLGLFLLSLHRQRPRSYWPLTASALAVALAFLTRYAGVALVATGMIGTLLLRKAPWKRRFMDAGIFCFLSSLPLCLWMARNLAVAGSATNRSAGFHPPTKEQLKILSDVVLAWLLPAEIDPRSKATILATVVALGLFIFFGRRGKKETIQKISLIGTSDLAPLLGLFIVSYALLLVLSISFFDYQIPINNRILSPVFVTGWILGCLVLRNLASLAASERLLRIGFATVGATFLLLQISEALVWLNLSYNSGLGYASRSWRDSGMIRVVSRIGPNVPVFTNGPDAISLLTGRPAYMIPNKVNPRTNTANENYFHELEGIRRKLKEQNGVLIYFKTIPWRWYLPSESELIEKLDLRLRMEESDSSMYQADRG